ncbi:MAG: hypothetical protein ACFFDH_08850, partial [Promethearchaeota archaeon]
MNNKKSITFYLIILISIQFLVGLTYFNLNTRKEIKANILEPDISDSDVGNYTFYGISFQPLLNESIKIGVLGDLGYPLGLHNWQGAQLAAKEINEGGGIIINSTNYYIGLVGANTEESNETVDVMKGVEAANNIIYNDPHAIIGGSRNESVTAYLEPIMDAEILFLGTGVSDNAFCQKVNNSYSRYKYFFRVMPSNSTTIGTEVLIHLANRIVNLNASYDGWCNKVAILRENLTWSEGMSNALQDYLALYVNAYSGGGMTLSSLIEYNISTSITYSEMSVIWNQINTLGTQLVIPIFSSNASKIVSQTYRDLQPMCLMEGINVKAQLDDFWDDTEGTCEYEGVYQSTYNISKTYKTIPFWNSYVDEYNIEPLYTGIGAYEAVYMFANASLSSQSLKADDIITGLEGFNKSNPFVGLSALKVFWNNTHDLAWGYPYAFGIWCQWQSDGTKVVLPSTYGAYPPSLATGSLNLPYWGINNLVAPQDIPANFTLSSDADIPVDIDGTFNLIWSPSAGADNYSVYIYDRNISYISKRYALNSYVGISSSTTSYPISGLADGEEYYYIVVAYNETGERLSNNIHVEVHYPPGQFSLSSDAEVLVGTDVFVDTDGNFNLTWTNSSRAISYSVFQSFDNITMIDGSLTAITIGYNTSLSIEVTGLEIGLYYYIVQAYNGYNYTLSNCIEVNIQYYDDLTGIWELLPLVIDNTGNGDYTWSDILSFPWCSGSGTVSSPYIIDSIEIDGQGSGSCLTVQNSDTNFIINGSSFSNSGIGDYDG